MQLKTLLDAIDIHDYIQENDFMVSGISYNSRNVEKNHLFICIKGYETDGHLYLQDAMERGAKAAIVEEFNLALPIAQYRVENSRIALAYLSAAYYDHPADKMNVVGITATNGKTTTAFMTDAILERHGLKTGLIGTINVKMGNELIPADLTTPESLELHSFFSDMEKNDTSHVIMEVSSAAQEMHRVDAVNFDMVTLNNISREHIDTHGSFEAYVKTKTKLIRHANRNSLAILNLDCAYSENLIKKTKATPVTFSVEEERGHVCVKNLDLSTGRAKFIVKVLKPIHTNNVIIHPIEFPIELAIPGLHSVSNSMVAVMISMLNNVPIETIQETLKDFKGVERRFEFIHEKDITVIDDHFANPGNIDVTLETISLMNFKDLRLIYAIRGQRGADVNKENAEALVKWANKLGLEEIIVTRSASDVTSRDTVTDEESQAFQKVLDNANIKVHFFNELDESIYEGLNHAKKGDLLLLAGCQGMDHGAEITLKALRDRPIIYNFTM